MTYAHEQAAGGGDAVAKGVNGKIQRARIFPRGVGHGTKSAVVVIIAVAVMSVDGTGGEESYYSNNQYFSLA